MRTNFDALLMLSIVASVLFASASVGYYHLVYLPHRDAQLDIERAVERERVDAEKQAEREKAEAEKREEQERVLGERRRAEAEKRAEQERQLADRLASEVLCVPKTSSVLIA